MQISRRRLVSGGYVVFGKSVTDERVPEVAGTVRAEARASGSLLLPFRGATLVVFIAEVDPKGWLPSAIVDKVNSLAPLGIIGLRKAVTGSSQAKTEPPPELDNQAFLREEFGEKCQHWAAPCCEEEPVN